ncbi:MAG: hypothetical protein EAZ92_16750 [Candidatus Kapaibacterium sp.]|nr:MAG: hypothetical protein EAZ92_16750 [Candidatus Kapabacteria bacterium]
MKLGCGNLRTITKKDSSMIFWTQMKMIEWMKMMKMQKTSRLQAYSFYHLHQSNHLHLRPLFTTEISYTKS